MPSNAKSAQKSVFDFKAKGMEPDNYYDYEIEIFYLKKPSC
jgi:hypothetical protein